MSAGVRLPSALLVAGLLLVAGCGGGDDDGKTTTAVIQTSSVSDTVPPDVARRANANCRDLIRETQDVSKGAIQRYQGSFESLTAIVRGLIPVLEGFADRQRALQGAADSSSYDRYLEFFDPAIVVLQHRLRAGEKQDVIEARRLNGLMAGIAVEQKNAAHDAGLTGCDVDFTDVVTKAAFPNH